MASKTPITARRIAARTRRLRRENPTLDSSQHGDAVRHLAGLLLTRDHLLEKLLEDKLDARGLRSLSDTNRAIIDALARLGLLPAAPKAGTEPDWGEPEPGPEPEPEEEANYARRGRLRTEAQGKEAPAKVAGRKRS